MSQKQSIMGYFADASAGMSRGHTTALSTRGDKGFLIGCGLTSAQMAGLTKG